MTYHETFINLKSTTMKKLGLTLVAVGLFFATTQAQVVGEVQSEVEVEVADAGNEFETIEITALPEAVNTAITTEFPEALTTEAFVKNEDEVLTYKVKLNIEGIEKEVYLDAEGNWIDKEEVKEEDN